jgi:succinyl-diaminopimelate desuccinylase
VLDLSIDVVSLAAALVDAESVSGNETALADDVERALQRYPTLQVQRIGNTVVATTPDTDAPRIILAGHLDTVPIADNVPSHIVDGRLFGCGTSDMKSGVAVQLRTAHLVGSGELDSKYDLTWIFYDCEEVEAARNGLGKLVRSHPELVKGDLAILLEPTSGLVEGGCQGTIRIVVTTTGTRAHSARSWLGVNAIHAAGEILNRLAAYEARVVDVDGLTYREGLNAVFISGGVAGNVIPDECAVTVNFRFAPDRTEDDAVAHLREVFAGYEFDVVDSAPAARPGLQLPAAAAFVAAVGTAPAAKLGWTDVARFSELGVPALNFGPGDPNLAHTRDESVDIATIRDGERALAEFLSTAPPR